MLGAYLGAGKAKKPTKRPVRKPSSPVRQVTQITTDTKFSCSFVVTCNHYSYCDSYALNLKRNLAEPFRSSLPDILVYEYDVKQIQSDRASYLGSYEYQVNLVGSFDNRNNVKAAEVQRGIINKISDDWTNLRNFSFQILSKNANYSEAILKQKPSGEVAVKKPKQPATNANGSNPFGIDLSAITELVRAATTTATNTANAAKEKSGGFLDSVTGIFQTASTAYLIGSIGAGIGGILLIKWLLKDG